MRKTLIAILLAVALTVIPVSSVLAANTADVTVTATPGWVSITVDPASHDFGVVLAGDTPDTTSGAGFTITNNSTVAMDVDIECDGWTDIASVPEGTDWTYADTAGTDTGSLNFSTTGGAPWTFIPETPTTASLASDVATGVDPTFDLQLEAPTGFTHVDEQQSVITLTASVHT
jgi:hypothetical protein